MHVFERLESEVRGYCRSFPAVFDRALGSRLFDEKGRPYIDFFSGAGALNYGHNHPHLKRRLLDYLERDGITHALDMATAAKRDLLERFEEVILQPRGLDYKIQFPGPTGTNAVESALKLARKVTGRESIVSFTNAFHGMTLGSLSVTGNGFKRRGAGVPLVHVSAMPFDGYMGEDVDTLDYLAAFLEDDGSGIDLPAAVIVETIQAEGGINVARQSWLQRLEGLCRRYEMLLIVDDIQVGCGRTGPFFSFEELGIRPDLVCLSKSLSGYGLPLALTLIRPDLDVWDPGEHNGTFRGHNPAFVTATAALDFWETKGLHQEVLRKGEVVRGRLEDLACKHESLGAQARGRGLIQGLDCPDAGFASEVSAAAFERGLVLETSGPESTVVKVMPPLVIEDDLLEDGLQILAQSLEAVIAARRGRLRVANPLEPEQTLPR
ncbi:MAG: diaminobutyrate--2-oxoglutarate transaminase [Dehalococcoidia bacterium]